MTTICLRTPKEGKTITSNIPTFLLLKKEGAQIRCSNEDTLIQIRFLSFCLQLGLGTPGRLLGWALQGVGWALQGDSGLGHSRETPGLGTPGSLWGRALQGISRSRPGKEKSSGRREELSLKSNNPTPKVGKKKKNEHPYIALIREDTFFVFGGS